MQIVDVDQIKEVDCGTAVENVNNELAKGWVLLGMRMTEMIEGERKNQYPVYILGRPRSTQDQTTGFADVSEVKEVDLGMNFEGVNTELSAGWRILAIRLYQEIEGEKKNQYPIYIMGR